MDERKTAHFAYAEDRLFFASAITFTNLFDKIARLGRDYFMTNLTCANCGLL